MEYYVDKCINEYKREDKCICMRDNKYSNVRDDKYVTKESKGYKGEACNCENEVCKREGNVKSKVYKRDVENKGYG